MRLTMQDGSKQAESGEVVMPTITIPAMTSTSAAEHKYLTKKRIISAIVVVSVAALVLTGILVGIWMFNQNNQMMLQYEISLLNENNDKGNQDVSTNLAENIVQYHVKTSTSEWWIVEDFNRDLKVTKVQENTGVTQCLVSALDPSTSPSPSSIVSPASSEQKAIDAVSATEMMTIAANPVSDSSFLGKTASNLCSGLPVYWTYTSCFNETTADAARSKRSALACAPCGCHYQVCVACGIIHYTYVLRGNIWYCNWSVQTCIGTSYYVYGC